jgi:chemotaxis signal transduction protein
MSTEEIDEASYARILEQRARRLLQTVERVEHRHTIAVLVVRVANDLVGICADQLDGAVELDTVAHLAGAPPFVLGLAVYRGALVSVVDLAAWLQIGRVERATGLVVVATHTQEPVAFRVDTIEGVRSLPAQTLDQSPSGGPAPRALTLAVTADLVRVLDLSTILTHPEFAPRGRR